MEALVRDFALILLTILFFILSLVYVRFCERVK
jgi:hypothetical protein